MPPSLVIYLLSTEEGGRQTPIQSGYRPQFYIRTTDVTATVLLPANVMRAAPGDHLAITVELATPVALERSTRFAVREGGKTIGAGTVTELLEDVL